VAERSPGRYLDLRGELLLTGAVSEIIVVEMVCVVVFQGLCFEMLFVKSRLEAR